LDIGTLISRTPAEICIASPAIQPFYIEHNVYPILQLFNEFEATRHWEA
jgi:hypothetical protein